MIRRVGTSAMPVRTKANAPARTPDVDCPGMGHPQIEPLRHLRHLGGARWRKVTQMVNGRHPQASKLGVCVTTFIGIAEGGGDVEKTKISSLPCPNCKVAQNGPFRTGFRTVFGPQGCAFSIFSRIQTSPLPDVDLGCWTCRKACPDVDAGQVCLHRQADNKRNRAATIARTANWSAASDQTHA